ncbi:MAG: Uma2 family endonuclease [Cyanobacteria bacterium J06639_1]
MDCEVSQKPVLQGEHSLLQVALGKTIDGAAQPQRCARAFSDLRCVFGRAAIVPDVSVCRWQRISRTLAGRIANRFETHPNWAIEILSPGQAQTQPLAKLLHCIESGMELGWLLDLEAESVLTISAESRIKLYRDDAPLPVLLPVLSGLELELSAIAVFSWLSLPT